MKKLFVISALALIFIGCNKDKYIDDISKGGLICTPLSKIVVPWGDQFTVDLQSNKAWSASTNKPWVKIDPLSGMGNAYVTITTASGLEDSAHIAFTNGTYTRDITIIRKDSSFLNRTRWIGGNCINNLWFYYRDSMQMNIITKQFETKDTCVYTLTYQPNNPYPIVNFNGTQPGKTKLDAPFDFIYKGTGVISRNERGEYKMIVESNTHIYYPQFGYTEDNTNNVDTLYLIK